MPQLSGSPWAAAKWRVICSRHDGKGVKHAGLIASVVPFMLKTKDNPKGTPQAIFDGMGAKMKADRAHFFAGFFKDFYGRSGKKNTSATKSCKPLGIRP